MSLSYRCKAPNAHVYLGDVLTWDPGLGKYRSSMARSEAWDPTVLMDGDSFEPMRQPKFGDPCSAKVGMHLMTGFVLGHEPRSQVHPSMTIVALDDPGSKGGYRIERIFGHRVQYLDRLIDPNQ